MTLTLIGFGGWGGEERLEASVRQLVCWVYVLCQILGRMGVGTVTGRAQYCLLASAY